MLRQRFLTALILIPLVVLLLYYGHSWLQISLALLVIVAMGLEWMQLVPVHHVTLKCLFIIGLLACLWINILYFMGWLIAGLILWGAALVAVLTFPASERYWGNRLVVGAACYIVLPVFLSCIIALYQLNQGKDLLLYLLCLVWATDIGAYFAGKQWGHNKLLVKVSPGKTREGAAGGIGLAMLVSLVGYFYFNPHSSWLWFVTVIVTILVSMLGDLFVSMLKRRAQIKDTGQLLPGHGGILDRMDSLMAACPIFYLGMLLQG